jgi:hypothetical protein
MLMTAWLTCWRVIETFSDNLGNWILCHTKSTGNKRHAHQRNNRKRAGWRPRGTAIAMTVLAMQANATIATERKTQFDTDSETIGIDNRCSGCISHVRDDFVGELRRTDRVVKGFAGTKTTNVQVGTLRWSWEDELGRKHTFTIPNSSYVPDGRVLLLSPQHWSQTQTTGPERDQCGEYTNGRECVLFWGGGKHKMRIPLGKRDNVATFSMASGFDKFRAFCSEAKLNDTTRNVIAMPTGFVSDDEDDDELKASDEAHRNKAWRSQSDSGPKPMLHDLDGPSSTPSKGETPKASTKKQPPTVVLIVTMS